MTKRRSYRRWILLAVAIISVAGIAIQWQRPAPIPVRSNPFNSKLIQDSLDGKTLYESDGVRLCRHAKEKASKEFDPKHAVEYVAANPNYTAYHLLFCLKELAPDDYESLSVSVKAKVLSSALENLVFLNGWGHLGPDYEIQKSDRPAMMLLALGKPAIEHLVPILDNKNRAYHFGSEDATLSDIDHYRRCDYAFRFITTLLGVDSTFHEELDDRDRAIEKLKTMNLR